MKIVPRQYQELATEAALIGLLGSLMRALVVIATGLGKTFTAAFITRAFCSKRTLFLVHNNHILKHALDEFKLVFGDKVVMAVYNGLSKRGAEKADIVFATWQTMGPNLKKWKKNHFDLIIVDEAHHEGAETYRPTLKYFNAAKLGITATPNRMDEDEDIRDVFGPEVINISREEAIARGWLPPIEYHVITDESLDEAMLQVIVAEIKVGKKRFTMAEVNRRLFIRKRDDKIAEIINGYNEKALVFCASIGHAERLAGSLKLGATFHSDTGESAKDTWNINQATLAALKNGTIRRVCAVNAFNEGVNVPSIGLISFCRTTDSQNIFDQQIGRGLRPEKDKLIVLDFVGNLERIQLVLGMMNKIADLREEYASRGEIDNEGYNRKVFEVSGKGFEFTFSDQIVDLMKVLDHCERDFYPTWQEASVAVQKLGIKSRRDYRKRYKEDERLPSAPGDLYPNFPGYTVFLGIQKYETCAEASAAAQKLGIKSMLDYKNRYKEDERLPSSPQSFYPDFPGYPVFLGGDEKTIYETCAEASAAAQKLGISSFNNYQKRYKEDKKLPSVPEKRYPDFPGYTVFLGTQKYKTCAKASVVAQKFGIKSRKDYKRRYKNDKRLPSDPQSFYPNFPGWPKFLGKT